ncbi:hypothetical protein BH18ACT14_BH18ACT14_01160 [soil metagenome]
MRTAALVVGLVILLALVAAASRAGLPWSEHSGGDGDGVSLQRVAQLAALVALSVVTGVLAVAFTARARRRSRRDPFEAEDELIEADAEPESRLARFLLRVGPYALVAGIAVSILFAARGIDRIVPRDTANRARPAQAEEDRTVPAVPGPAAGATWVLLGVLGVFGALTVVFVLCPHVRRSLLDARAGRDGAVAMLVDESIDDLRSESDPRRAVIAAYARMERGLGRAGLARKPFETPLEYLRRVLLDLQAGAQPVGRLTDLFERAKFSRHDVSADAKDEAIECLLAIRGNLRTAQ